MRRVIDHLTYANVVSTLCLFVLLGGGAYAAAKLQKDSVGSKQIKAGAVKSADIKDEGVKGADIDEGDLGTVPRAQSAAAVGGLGAGSIAKTFGANINDTVPDPIFAVPELDAQLLGDTSPASASCFRVRNTSNEGVIQISDLANQAGSLFAVPQLTTSADSCVDGPLVLTNDAFPDQMLLFGCAETGRAYCFGQLINTPTL